MRIKICGITKEDEADYLNKARVDYAGFVFYDESKRNVTIKQASRVAKKLNPDIKRVAVVVSPVPEDFQRLEDSVFDVIQIHGNLDEEILKIARKPVWCAINLTDEKFEERMRWLKSLDDCNYNKIKGIVIDSKDFGSGKTFDWNKNKDKIDKIRDKTFILAGGLTSQNVGEAIKVLNPDVVDVSSGVEPYKDKVGKDEKLIDAFVKAVRKEAL